MTEIIVNPFGNRTDRRGYDRLGPDECWPWLGSCDPDGYGQVFNKRLGRVDKAHIVVWELTWHLDAPRRGSGLELHHTCHLRKCCNPAHVSVVTVQVNRITRRPRPRKSLSKLHGTASGYTNRKCRCQPCRTAWASYTRERRAAGKQTMR